MASETVSIELNDTWKLVSNAPSGRLAMAWYGSANGLLIYFGSTPPHPGENPGIDVHNLVVEDTGTKVYAKLKPIFVVTIKLPENRGTLLVERPIDPGNLPYEVLTKIPLKWQDSPNYNSKYYRGYVPIHSIHPPE